MGVACQLVILSTAGNYATRLGQMSIRWKRHIPKHRRPRESGDPERATCRWPWVPAFAGTTILGIGLVKREML